MDTDRKIGEQNDQCTINEFNTHYNKSLHFKIDECIYLKSFLYILFKSLIRNIFKHIIRNI